MAQKLLTLQRHVAMQQTASADATGEFTRLLWDLQIAFKLINRDVNQAGLANVLGATDRENVHGERVMRLDWLAQERIYQSMNHGGHLCVMASEECDDIISISRQHPKGNYVLVYDPLDGSSNIDANASIATIFAIYRRKTAREDGTIEDCLRRGNEQVAAGYVVYGSSTMLVYTTGQGVHGFTLDPSMGEFILSHPDIRIPSRGKYYSVNEGNSAYFDEGTKKYIEYIKTPDTESGRPYSGRYIGTLAADIHRNLLAGGIYLYPAAPRPKLRLVYEAIPMAFIVEQAGGVASDGTRPIMEIQPTDLHEKTPLVIGSRDDVETYLQFLKDAE